MTLFNHLPVGLEPCVSRIMANNAKNELAEKVYHQNLRIQALEQAIKQMYASAMKNDFKAPDRASWENALSLVDVSRIETKVPIS